MVLTLDIAATRVTMLMAPRRRNCESCPPYKRHTHPMEDPVARVGHPHFCREVFINTYFNIEYYRSEKGFS